MKILIVCTHSSRGGAGMAVKAFTNGLQAHGHEVKMLVQRVDSKDDIYAVKVGGTRNISRIKSFLDTKLPSVLCGSDYTFSCGLVGTNVLPKIREFNPDAVIIHWINKGFLSWKNIYEISKEYPTLIHMHDWWYMFDGEHIDSSYFPERSGVNKLMKSILNKIVKVSSKKVRQASNIRYIAPSNFLKSEAKKAGIIKESSISVVNNFVKLTDDFLVSKSEARQQLGLDNKKKYIILSSVNINKDVVKGGVYLKAIFKEYFNSEKYPDIGVISFGSENPFPTLDLPKQIETVHLGWVTRKQALAAFAAADLYCITSLVESFSLTTLESLLVGTPVLGFRTGALPELIEDNLNGQLVKPFDIGLYVMSLKRILAKGVKQSGKEISQAAKLKFNEEKSISQYEKLIQEHIKSLTL